MPTAIEEMLIRRLEACEARQRDHEMHDPDCPIRAYQKHDAMGWGIAVRIRECDCWLSKKAPIFNGFKTTIGDGSTYIFNITHNLGSTELYQGKKELDISAKVIETGLELMDQPYGPRVEYLDLNTLRFVFPTTLGAPSTNSIEITILSKEKSNG